MKNEQGMTLVELITTMAILAIIGIILVNFLFTSSNVFESRKLANEQTIIMDHLRTVITDKVRYMEVLEISNATTSTEANCESIISRDNKLICKDEYGVESDLTSENIIGTHSVIVEFEKASDTVLRVRVYLDSATDYKREEIFTIKLMNIELYNDNIIEEGSGVSIQQIYYKNRVG